MRRTPLLKLGITGTIGSGKSLVGKFLEELGVPVIDTDKVVHHIFNHDKNVQAAIAKRFGNDVLIKNGDGTTNVDRKALAIKVFSDKQARKDLEAIVHPCVRSECHQLIESLSADDNIKVVATLVPLLFESQRAHDYDEVWTVIADEKSIYRRLASRDNLSQEEIAQRLKAQLPQTEKAAAAKHVIDNSGDLAQTRRQVERYLAEFLRDHPQE